MYLSTRAARAGLRGTEMLEARTGRQLPQIEKASRADYVIATDGSLEELERQVSALIELLRRPSGAPR